MRITSVSVVRTAFAAAVWVAMVGLAAIGAARSAAAAGTLYGMFYDATTTSYVLGSIDAPTGAVTLIGDGIPARWISFSGNQIGADADLGVAWVVAGPNDGPSTDRSVYTVDLATGAAADTHPLQDVVAPVADLSLNPFFADYDAANGTLYVLTQTQPSVGDRVWYLATLDPTTGEVDPIGNGFALSSAGSVSALDAAHGVFYFIGRETSGGADQIYSLSLATGAVLEHPNTSSGIATLATAPDFLVYDPATDELLGLFGSTETDPRTRYLMVIDPSTGALVQRGDTFVDQYANAQRGALDPAAGRWYVQYRLAAEPVFKLYTLDVAAASGTVVASPTMSHGDPDVREYPDFLVFVPEPGAAALALAAGAALSALARRRRAARLSRTAAAPILRRWPSRCRPS